MSKSSMKADLLKMLRDEMMDEDRDEMHEMMEEGDKMPKKKIQATIMADDKEGILKAAKKLPEVMSKADKYMKMRLGDKK
jgi:hypothetical protein